MKWCEHFPDGVIKAYWGHEWNFCPICGNPRPKEKTLEEKFGEFWGTNLQRNKSAYETLHQMAKIAEEHYDKP